MAYLEAANALHCSRAKAAAELDRLIMRELPPLKMEKARFETKIEKQSEASWTEQGFDDVYFTVATNPNSPQGPLNKIASGGELSRFMLALKVNLAASSNVCTMILTKSMPVSAARRLRPWENVWHVWEIRYRFWLLPIRLRWRPAVLRILRLKTY